MTTDDADEDRGLVTGILDAERRGVAALVRRRRVLIAVAVLALVVVAAVLAVITIRQQQANQRAQEEAAAAEARTALATGIVDRAESYEPLATTVDERTTSLRGAMEALLADADTDVDTLVTQARDAADALGDVADTLTDLTAQDLPEAPEPIDPDRAVEALRALEGLRAEAGALAEETGPAVDGARTWLAAVADVTRALDANNDVVAATGADSASQGPDELIAQWQDERPTLGRLADAAAAAREVPGLDTWAGAHESYATDVLTWIDEAVALLEDGQVDTYNQRLDEVFDGEDPFDLEAAVAASSEEVFASEALLQLGSLRDRATLVAEAVTSTETTVAEVLDGAVATGAFR